MKEKIILTTGNKIFAKSPHTGEVFDITNDLYFFEKEGIQALDCKDIFGAKWEIWIELTLVNNEDKPNT